MKRLVIFALLISATLIGCNSKSKEQQSVGEQMLEMLNKQGLSLLVYKNDSLTTHTNRGIADLLSLVATQPQRLEGAIVADKIIGKAAAALRDIKQIYCVRYASHLQPSSLWQPHCYSLA
jgi:hypothetical protein